AMGIRGSTVTVTEPGTRRPTLASATNGRRFKASTKRRAGTRSRLVCDGRTATDRTWVASSALKLARPSIVRRRTVRRGEVYAAATIITVSTAAPSQVRDLMRAGVISG